MLDRQGDAVLLLTIARGGFHLIELIEVDDKPDFRQVSDMLATVVNTTHRLRAFRNTISDMDERFVRVIF
jgi:hypothetical protein